MLGSFRKKHGPTQAAMFSDVFFAINGCNKNHASTAVFQKKKEHLDDFLKEFTDL